MKVSQLIEALQQLPPDAAIVVCANNHTTDSDDTICVAAAVENDDETVVVLGNWEGWNIGHWHGRIVPRSPVFEGDGDELKRLTIKHKPARKAERRTWEDVPESWELDDE